jgi:predicted O-methyltransferase YrrM
MRAICPQNRRILCAEQKQLGPDFENRYNPIHRSKAVVWRSSRGKNHKMTSTEAAVSNPPVEVIPCPLLHKIFASGKVESADGREIPLVANIAPEYAVALYRAVKASRPKAVVEIGMATGIATVTILTALNEIGEGGRLITIDPFQNAPDVPWSGVGVANVQRSGFAASHSLIEKYDYLALPKLVGDGQRIQFAYIDGWHTFDYTLLDFFFVDKMMDPDGVVGFNDCGYRAVDRALRYVMTHRKYAEIDVGLAANYRGRNPMVTVARRLMKFSQNDRYFKKLVEYEPDWHFYARF